MFVWCIVLFHLFLSRIVTCLQDHLYREWESRDNWKNLHKFIWWALGRGRAGSCLRQQAARGEGFCEAGGHWGYQLVAPSSRGYHLLHSVLCTKAATLELLPKESSLKQIDIPQVCLSFSYYLSCLMVRAARPLAPYGSKIHFCLPWWKALSQPFTCCVYCQLRLRFVRAK